MLRMTSKWRFLTPPKQPFAKKIYSVCHSRESGNLFQTKIDILTWIPVFAGMTVKNKNPIPNIGIGVIA